MKSFHLSPAAVHDLEEIEAHIASERPSAVDDVLDAIEAACRLVAEYPRVGRARDELDEGLLSFPIGSYILFYYVDENPAGIARVLHGSRDIAAVFHSP